MTGLPALIMLDVVSWPKSGTPTLPVGPSSAEVIKEKQTLPHTTK